MQGEMHLIGRLHGFALTQKLIGRILKNARGTGEIVQHVCRVEVHQATSSVHCQKVVFWIMIKAVTINMNERIHLRHAGHHWCYGNGQVGWRLGEAASHCMMVHLARTELGWCYLYVA